MKSPTRTVILLASGLVLVFTYAALSKLLAFSLFRMQLGLQPLPNWSKPWLLYLLPLGELGVVGLLLAPRTRPGGFLASIILLTLFSGYILLGILHLFGKVPCSCGGIIRGFTWPQHLVFNLLWLGVAIWGWRLERNAAMDRYLQGRTPDIHRV